MLSKSICLKCELREKDHTFDDLWNEGKVYCFILWRICMPDIEEAFKEAKINEVPPDYCPYALEHVLLQQGEEQYVLEHVVNEGIQHA